jgi:hypothetical protein
MGLSWSSFADSGWQEIAYVIGGPMVAIALVFVVIPEIFFRLLSIARARGNLAGGSSRIGSGSSAGGSAGRRGKIGKPSSPTDGKGGVT